jgi:tRNA pseudouridine55 synthase
VVRTSRVPDLSPEVIREKAERFLGDIKQTPPTYSALKHRGIRAYKLARKGVKIKLEERTVTVHSLRILSVHLPHFTMEVRCSSGTYIRSLGADLAAEIGPGGHLKSLRRIASGTLKVQEALSSAKIEAEGGGRMVRERIISLNEALPEMEEKQATMSLATKIRRGYQPTRKDLGIDPDSAVFGKEDSPAVGGRSQDPVSREPSFFKIVRDTELVAIASLMNSEATAHRQVRIERVFT